MDINANLSPRENQMAKLLAWGASKKEIAVRLFVSPRTVENTARNIYVKADVRSKNELSAWYFCKYHNISPALNPLLAACFLFLVVINEFNKADAAPLRAKKVHVAKTKKRRADDDTA